MKKFNKNFKSTEFCNSGFLDFWDFLGFNRRQCVRDWSGILCERSEQRYSGKPDGFAGTPRKRLKSKG